MTGAKPQHSHRIACVLSVTITLQLHAGCSMCEVSGVSGWGHPVGAFPGTSFAGYELTSWLHGSTYERLHGVKFTRLAQARASETESAHIHRKPTQPAVVMLQLSLHSHSYILTAQPTQPDP